MSYHVGAYWGARRETIDACADRLARFLTDLSSCDAVFSRWYKLGMSRRKALKGEIEFRNRDDLLHLLERGRSRTDTGKRVIEELGFQVCMWNGGTSKKAINLSVRCGSYWTGPGMSSNSVSLELPEDLGDLQDPNCMAKVLLAVARCWEPDAARVSAVQDIQVEDVVPGKPVEGPRYFSWMFYVSRKRVSNPIVPAPSSVMPVDDIGSLIVVQAEAVDAANPVHLQRAKSVERVLGIK